MDRLDAMQAFVAVADLGGFAPAARKLRVSASAVTRLIAALEERVGARLLQRTTRSVALTDAGARYLERVRRILADIDDADASAQAERAVPTGQLVVSAPMGFGRRHVAPVMSDYLQRYPQVRGELRLSDAVVNLVEEGVDLAVRIAHLPDSSLVARAVGDMHRLVVASPAFIAAHGEPKRPADLAGRRIIHFGTSGGPASWRFHEDGKDIRIDLVPHYATNNADAAVAHAQADGGFTRVLSYQAADALAAGRLRVVLRAYQLPPIPVHIVYPTARLLSAKVRAFIDLVHARCDWHFAARDLNRPAASS